MVDVAEFILARDDLSQFLVAQEPFEDLKMIEKFGEEIMESWIEIRLFLLAPVKQKPIPLNLDESSAITVDKPDSRQRKSGRIRQAGRIPAENL